MFLEKNIRFNKIRSQHFIKSYSVYKIIRANSTDASRVELFFIQFDFSSGFGHYSVLKNKNKYILNDIIISRYIKIRTATVFYSVSTLSMGITRVYIFLS